MEHDDHRKKARERAAAKAYDRAAASSPPGEGGRFKAMEGMMEAKGAKSPAGLAAHIGRRKFGKGRFQRMAAAGKKG